RISEADYRTFLTERGQGWVALLQDQLIGFAVVDVQERNVWALFVHPDHEDRGAGGKLHDTMLAWTFDQGLDHLWLSTDPDTRAAEFYRRRQWHATGTLPNAELRFEITAEAWRR
ncbi:MAG: GNAT family N-acetyltransferase, partial [Flavobacteriales bacterium]|nr:GNAT family N-acetyltransferase [Flavobacteriales bacterium]